MTVNLGTDYQQKHPVTTGFYFNTLRSLNIIQRGGDAGICRTLSNELGNMRVIDMVVAARALA